MHAPSLRSLYAKPGVKTGMNVEFFRKGTYWMEEDRRAKLEIGESRCQCLGCQTNTPVFLLVVINVFCKHQKVYSSEELEWNNDE
jgi:hypothetical protein